MYYSTHILAHRLFFEFGPWTGLRDIFLVRGVIAIPKMFRRCKKLKLEVFTQFQLTSLLIKDSPGKKMVAG